MRKEGSPYAGDAVPTPDAPQQEKILTELEKTLVLLNELKALHAGLMQHSNEYIALDKSGAKRNNLGFSLGRWVIDIDQNKQTGFHLKAKQQAVREDEKEIADLTYSIYSEGFRKASRRHEIGTLSLALTDKDRFPDSKSADLKDIYSFGEGSGPITISQIRGTDINRLDDEGAHIKKDEEYSEEDEDQTEKIIGHGEIQRRTIQAIARLKEITDLLDQHLLPQQGK